MSVEEVGETYMNELYHYGIKGQKWGVRRYQNKDGSLTEAGKKRIREAGNLGFPTRDKKTGKPVGGSVENRFNIPKSKSDDEFKTVVENERARILSDKNALKKAGYKFVKNPDSDTREHNDDIVTMLVLESRVYKEARLKNTKDYIDRYADATIADLGLKNTEQTKAYVKQYLADNDRTYQRLSEELKINPKINETEKQRAKSVSDKTVFDNLKADFRITNKGYGYSARTDVGSHKNVAVNMIIRENDMSSKVAKAKAQKSQKFINDLKNIETENNIKGRLKILDVCPDDDVARAVYSSGRVDFKMSTREIARN